MVLCIFDIIVDDITNEHRFLCTSAMVRLEQISPFMANEFTYNTDSNRPRAASSMSNACYEEKPSRSLYLFVVLVTRCPGLATGGHRLRRLCGGNVLGLSILNLCSFQVFGGISNAVLLGILNLGSIDVDFSSRVVNTSVFLVDLLGSILSRTSSP